MPTATIGEYITRGEYDIRQKSTDEKVEHKDEQTNNRISSLERLLDERFAKLEAVMEKNAARQEGMIGELKGEMKAINARIDGLDKRMDDLHQTQTRWFTLFGVLITVVPIVVSMIQRMLN